MKIYFLSMFYIIIFKKYISAVRAVLFISPYHPLSTSCYYNFIGHFLL